MQCCAVLCSAVQCNAAQCSSVQFSAFHCSSVHDIEVEGRQYAVGSGKGRLCCPWAQTSQLCGVRTHYWAHKHSSTSSPLSRTPGLTLILTPQPTNYLLHSSSAKLPPNRYTRQENLQQAFVCLCIPRWLDRLDFLQPLWIGKGCEGSERVRTGWDGSWRVGTGRSYGQKL